jgi:hypothetical protein
LGTDGGGNAAHLGLNQSHRLVEEVQGGVRSGGRDLVSGGAVVSARELAGVGAAMAAQFLCVEAE